MIFVPANTLALEWVCASILRKVYKHFEFTLFDLRIKQLDKTLIKYTLYYNTKAKYKYDWSNAWSSDWFLVIYIYTSMIHLLPRVIYPCTLSFNSVNVSTVSGKNIKIKNRINWEPSYKVTIKIFSSQSETRISHGGHISFPIWTNEEILYRTFHRHRCFQPNIH